MASFENLDFQLFAVHAVIREYQQQSVVDLNGQIDVLDEFLGSRHVFRNKPDTQLFATHLLVRSPSDLLVQAAVAAEARLVSNRLHRPDERRQVGDEIFGHAAPTQELVGQF